jgi:hypothetical protein
MRPDVRQLYKQLLFLGRDYPADFNVVRQKVRNAFLRNRDVSDEKAVEKLVAHGRYVAAEMEALIKLKKYRTLKRNYGTEWSCDDPFIGFARKYSTDNESG